MKDRKTYAILALLLGGIGVHRFYVGQPLFGLLYFVLCWTFIPMLVSIVEAIMWFTRSDEQFQQHVEKIQAANAARIAASQAKQQAKRDALAQQYGEAWVDHILRKEIVKGMPESALIASWGRPREIKTDTTSSTTKKKLYYQPYRNSKGNTSYKKEVRLENGVVSGWKDL